MDEELPQRIKKKKKKVHFTGQALHQQHHPRKHSVTHGSNIKYNPNSCSSSVRSPSSSFLFFFLNSFLPVSLLRLSSSCCACYMCARVWAQLERMCTLVRGMEGGEESRGEERRGERTEEEEEVWRFHQPAEREEEEEEEEEEEGQRRLWGWGGCGVRAGFVDLNDKLRSQWRAEEFIWTISGEV